MVLLHHILGCVCCSVGGWHEKMMHVRATGETLWNICEAKHLFVRTTTLQTWLTLHRLLWKGATSTEMERYPRRYWNFVHYAQFLKSRIVFFPATYLGWYWCIWYLYLRSFNSYRRYIPSPGADGDLDGSSRPAIEIRNCAKFLLNFYLSTVKDEKLIF